MDSAAAEISRAKTSLKGKGVLITGGTTGIGRAIARLLAAEGAKIFIFGRDVSALDDAMEAISKIGEIGGMSADASVRADVDRVFAEAERAMGQVDVLIDNAAVSAEGLTDESEDDWRYAVETNLIGYLAFAKRAAEPMQKRGEGHIVLIGSMSAEYRGKDSSVYVATKSALQGFAMSFRREVSEKGVKVTLIEPGLVGSDMIEAPPSEQRRKIAQGKMLKAEDIAEAVRFALIQPPRCVVMTMQVGEMHREKD